MKTRLLIPSLLILIALTGSHAQAQTKSSPLVGQWLTKGKTTVEFTPCGPGVCGKQIAADTEKDKQANGKTIAQDIVPDKDNIFTGLVFDPGNGKSYKSNWVLSADGKTLTLNVKWGFVSFKETWTRLK